jgi:membrane associated rhomboid family serine protease
MGLTYAAQFLTGGFDPYGLVTFYLSYIPEWTWQEPWRLVTVAFVHGGLMHILFNGYSLWVMGNLLERTLGSARFLIIFFASVIGGSLAVLVVGQSSFVVGASGGIFGLFAALFAVNRGFGGNNVSLVVIVGINLALGFIVPGVAWEAHIGGLIVGYLTTVTALKLRR